MCNNFINNYQMPLPNVLKINNDLQHFLLRKNSPTETTDLMHELHELMHDISSSHCLALSTEAHLSTLEEEVLRSTRPISTHHHHVLLLGDEYDNMLFTKW